MAAAAILKNRKITISQPQHVIWHVDAVWPSWPFHFENRLQSLHFLTGLCAWCLMFFKNIRCTEWQDSLLKSCNKTANIYVKKLQFIDTVDVDGSKTAKIIKGTINHINLDIQAMLVWLIVTFYDFCGFWSVNVNTVYKLQFFLHRSLIYTVSQFSEVTPKYKSA